MQAKGCYFEGRLTLKFIQPGGKTVKKTLVVMLAIVAIAAAGCKKKEEAPQATAPEAAAPGQAPAAAPGGNPHAGLKPLEVKPGAGHKGKVLETMDSGGYTYVQVDEN